MSYFSEMAIHEMEMEMEQYRDDNGMWECEFAEWVAAHEQDEQRLAAPIAAKTETQH